MAILHVQNLFPLNSTIRVPTIKLFSSKFNSCSKNEKIISKKISHLMLGIDHHVPSRVSSSFVKALGDQGDVIDTNGIGIVEFFEAKSLLVTGATGFLAKGNFTNPHSQRTLHTSRMCSRRRK